ncbi:MAG: 50S ribosomal protein L31 [Actinomycetota bacterium]|nr:50S ribosomal protein L31 [Actinomycetota bacterium]
MKKEIHPDYVETRVTCSCGNSFTTRSVKSELHVELCNKCHPFYTGKQKLVDTGGRVERFQKKYAATRAKAEAAAAERETGSTDESETEAAEEAPAQA